VLGHGELVVAREGYANLTREGVRLGQTGWGWANGCFLKFVRMERVFRRTGLDRGVSPRWGCLTDLLGTVTKCRIVAYHVNIVPRRTRGASGLRDDGTVDDDGAKKPRGIINPFGFGRAPAVGVHHRAR
jgi:hypothetical protein